MNRALRVLLLEDLPEDAELVQRTLAAAGIRCQVRRVDDREAFVAEQAISLQRQMLLRNEHLEVVANLIGGVAHELNNPLALLVGHATLLRRKAGDGPLAERADKITQAAERCARIVRNFLALARRERPERKPVDLGPLVRDTLEVLAYGLRVNGIEVEADLPPDLPKVPGDADRLRQLLANLVINAQNALRQTPTARRITVRVEAAEGAPVVRLVVEDNGPGVPPHLRERIFEPFVTTQPDGEGTGMGLPLCRGIVADHGGELRLEDAPGGGCRFVAELALTNDNDKDEPGPAAAPAADPGPASPSRGPRTILVVDDEPDIASLIGDALVGAGHAVDASSTAAATLERLRERQYDAVVADIRMPEMDGPRLYGEIERLHPELARRVVFVTGDTLSPTTAAFIRGIGAPVVGKPFEIEDLVRTVNRVLGA
jgi:signal transduction histidine kinase/CheY-like chemotaxis protein